MILVFGGNGQVGQSLVREASLRRIPLRALSRAEADITDASNVVAAVSRWRPSVVVNAAAFTKVDLAETESEAARRDNEYGPAVLARACAEAHIPLVHISTDYEFDGTKPVAYIESDPINSYKQVRAD